MIQTRFFFEHARETDLEERVNEWLTQFQSTNDQGDIQYIIPSVSSIDDGHVIRTAMVVYDDGKRTAKGERLDKEFAKARPDLIPGEKVSS